MSDGALLSRAAAGLAPVLRGVPIELTRVSKTYEARAGAIEALRSASLGVGAGEFVSLVGPSGCGKSTVLKLIGGLIKPTDGAITIADDQVVGPRRDVGVLFQTPVLFPWRDVLQNVILPAEIFGLDRSAAIATAKETLALVGLAGFEHAYPRELSGGMQQRVTLSRVLLTDPDVILMDEPFGALDEFTRERLNIELLRIWQDRRQSVVFVTHNIGEAVFLSDRVVVMAARPGRVLSIVDVPLERPRTVSMMRRPEFSQTVFSIREQLGVDV